MKLLKTYASVRKKTFTEVVEDINKTVSFQRYLKIIPYALLIWFSFLFCVITFIFSVRFALTIF